MINRVNGVSYYQQLSEILIEQIKNGIFQPGNQLPSEMDLSKTYKLNRHTVRQAVAILREEGFIYKIKGKGTFVSNKKVPYKVSRKTRFTTSILAAGLNPDAKLLTSYEITAGTRFARRLGVTPSDKVTVLEILRFADNIPFCYTTSFLSSGKFPGLTDLLKDSFSLYSLLKDHFGVEALRASSSFEVSMPEDPDMEILQISQKVPLLVVKSVSKDLEGNIVEYCSTKFRGDFCSITVDFNGEGR